jgi:hypothetical protein
VTTSDVAVDGAAEATADPPLTATLEANTPEAKKPDGYVSVILLPAVNAPPTVGVKVNVADEPDFPATRSLGAIENEAFDTRPPITPDAVPADGIKSALVETTIPLPFLPELVLPK